MSASPQSGFVPATENRPAFHYRGKLALLDRPATAFLCSTQCPGDKILEAYDWARRQCDEGGTVVSGFHTPVEKDVLAVLARRGAKIIWVRRSMNQEAIAMLEVGLAAPTKVPPRPLPEPVQLKRPTTMEETLRFIDDGLERRGLSQGS